MFVPGGGKGRKIHRKTSERRLKTGQVLHIRTLVGNAKGTRIVVRESYEFRLSIVHTSFSNIKCASTGIDSARTVLPFNFIFLAAILCSPRSPADDPAGVVHPVRSVRYIDKMFRG